MTTLPSTPVNTSASAMDNILYQPRIDALKGCDSNLLDYRPNSFLMIFRFRGRNLGMIASPLLCLLVWDAMCIFLLYHLEGVSNSSLSVESVREYLVWEDMVSSLLTPVSFLLVFRLGRAAVRFWDARAAAGKVVEVCRTLSSIALAGCAACNCQHSDITEEFARWICVFPITVKNYVRPVSTKTCDRRREIGPLLNDVDANEVLSCEFSPIYVLNRLRVLATRVASIPSSSAISPQMGALLYHDLNLQINALTGAWGAMERINSTPLPFVYVVHLRTFLLIYLVLWHMESIAAVGTISLLPLFAASWALLGIEAAAVECERPFRAHSNHLPLGKMCVVVSKNVAQTLLNIVHADMKSAPKSEVSTIERLNARKHHESDKDLPIQHVIEGSGTLPNKMSDNF